MSTDVNQVGFALFPFFIILPFQVFLLYECMEVYVVNTRFPVWFIHSCFVTARPWLVDGLDEWIDRLKGPPHKCAAIFVDNSGIDVILGILPFTRELLQRGTKVLFIQPSQH